MGGRWNVGKFATRAAVSQSVNTSTGQVQTVSAVHTSTCTALGLSCARVEYGIILETPVEKSSTGTPNSYS
jgi:hypothetical protein